MKRLIARPRSLLLVVALTAAAALSAVSTANAASSVSEQVIPAAPSELANTRFAENYIRNLRRA